MSDKNNIDSDPWSWDPIQSASSTQMTYATPQINEFIAADGQKVKYYSLGIDPIEQKPKSLESTKSHVYQELKEDSSWRSLVKAPKTRRPSLSKRIDDQIAIANLKKKYSLNECLDVFRELQEKQIGEIYLTGSVALYLQNRIKRTEFKDLDICIVGEYSLDDDMFDIHQFDYPEDPSGSKLKPVAFSGMKVDIFSDVGCVEEINIDYNGFTYRCQDYKQIMKAKMRMIIPKLKDYQELIGTTFEILYL